MSMISFIGQKVAQQLDTELMGPKYGFAVEQLMELAGFSCAQALAKVYALDQYSKVLVCCGPGNQGGDGLVAARHLWHWGYQPTLFYPKETDKELYKNLKKQCQQLSIPQVASDASMPLAKQDQEFERAVTSTDLILDCIFGFSFHGEPRPPFEHAIRHLTSNPHHKPIVSVDIPSAWDVEKGNTLKVFTPDLLVSLTCPKSGSREYQGRHFLGGRFVPPGILDAFGLKLPSYPGQDQVVEITQLVAQDNMKLQS